MTCISRTSRAAWLAALTLIAIAPAGALAADMPYWPSPVIKTSGPMRWDGINFGAQLGLSNMNTDFGNSTSDLVAYILRNTEVENQFSPSSWTALPSNTTNGRQLGAFLGYNWQWDELVVGFDAAYNYMSSMQTSASDTISRQVVTTPDNVNNAITITAQSSLKLIDYATARFRAGYTFGQFLPYAVVGGAVGRFNYANSATVHNVGTPPAGSPILPFDTLDTDSSAKNNAVVGGLLGGLGVDVSIFANVFLRAEWEYVAFAPVGGIRANMNT
ncbi:MAG: outer membrane protein, partial [Pseudolabrys sp.]